VQGGFFAVPDRVAPQFGGGGGGGAVGGQTMRPSSSCYESRNRRL
jgi:hypothetical protein